MACLRDIVDYALRCDKADGRYAYIAPLYAQAKDVAWAYLKSFVCAIPGAKPHESELRVDLPNGSRVRLYGADNYDRMRGIYLDGVILDEYGDMNPRAFPEVLRPALSDRKGWAVFIGTPKGRNAFYVLMHGGEESLAGPKGAAGNPDWYAMTLRASSSGLIDQEELNDARQSMSDDQYEQEYECSFDAAIVGAYYGKQMSDLTNEGRICAVPYDPSYPVHTGWDLGIDDATAVWCAQVIGREIRLIDYFESHDGLMAVAKILREKPYIYGEHYLPHDGDTREICFAKTRRQSLEQVGIKPIRIGTRQPPSERINAARNLLPRCVFDAEKCSHGIEVLRQYKRDWDDKLKTFRQTPKHDWASHGADAFGELAKQIHPAIIKRPTRRPNIGLTA